MTNKTAFVMLLLQAFSLTIVFAGENYKCTVTDTLQAEAVAQPGQKAGQSPKGKQFTVERATGVMSGAISNVFASQPTVFSFGSEESSYRVVSATGSDPTSATCTLVIEESSKEAQKPFVFIIDGITYYGMCVHF